MCEIPWFLRWLFYLLVVLVVMVFPCSYAYHERLPVQPAAIFVYGSIA